MDGGIVSDRIVKPSRFRRQHGRVARLDEQIADTDGEIGLPFRAESLLAQLERRGDITAQMRAGGEEFARLFHLAHLDPLKAADPARAPGAGDRHGGHASERARDRIARAMEALGGHGSPIGGAMWFVIGCEMPISEWARREGWGGQPIRREVAKGILVGALGVMEKHFGY